MILALGLAALLAQAPPITTGPNAGVLNADDVAQITALVAPKGCTPWVLTAHQVGSLATIAVSVDCAPSGGTAVRRGTRHSVVASVPKGLDQARTWQYERSASWAQVPLPGVSPDSREGATGQGRPFRVDPALTDADALSIVTFIRSNPRLFGFANQPQVPGDRAILSMRAAIDKPAPGRWEVLLPLEVAQDRSAVIVTVERRDGKWTVIAIQMVIWD